VLLFLASGAWRPEVVLVCEMELLSGLKASLKYLKHAKKNIRIETKLNRKIQAKNLIKT